MKRETRQHRTAPRRAPRMTQPEAMKTKAYVYGVETLNGNDAWALFQACAAGNIARVESLLAKDGRLVNAQFWYQFPIHFAVRNGDAELVRLLLVRGADPGESRFLYNSWDKLLRIAREREFHDVAAQLEQALRRRFNYSPDFGVLVDAIRSRNSRKLRDVMRRRPELALAADALGNNAVHWSVMTRQLGLIERFRDVGTPIDARRADGKTPILLALSWFRPFPPEKSLQNRWVFIGNLLAQGAEYALSVAAAVGDQERAEQLLQGDARLAGRLDSARVSPLSYAAREGHAHIVRLLLEHGADPNVPEDLAPHGRALFEACWGNHLRTAELLLKHGANPNAGLDSCGCCLTIGKSVHGRLPIPWQRLLRRYGAYSPPYEMSVRQMKDAIRDNHDVVRDEEFLGNLLRKRNAELLDLFLDSDRSIPDRLQVWGGVTYPRSPGLVRQLLARGLDPDRTDWLGKTFLHACAENADRSVSAVFLEAGADINARDVEYSGTPLAAAVRAGSPDEGPKLTGRRRRMIEFLLKCGAATDLPDDEPWATPLAWARKRGLVEIEAILLKHGAQGVERL